MRKLLLIFAASGLINSAFASAESPQVKSVFEKLKASQPQTVIVCETNLSADDSHPTPQARIGNRN